MNQKGQFWSLDILLAAAIFTLAIGLILSSSELSIFYDQQEKNSQQLLSLALLGSNNLMSQSDIVLRYIPLVCDTTHGGNIALCTIDPVACGPACGLIDISNAFLNARCGPNSVLTINTAPLDPLPDIVVSNPGGWVADNELSGLENCFVDHNAVFRQGPLGIFSEYGLDINALLSNGSSISYYMAHPITQDFFSIQRRALIFSTIPTASDLRECLDGNCSQYLTDANFRVWRI